MLLRVLFILFYTWSLSAAEGPRLEQGKLVLPKETDPKTVRVVLGGGTDKDIAARPALAGDWTTTGTQHTFTPLFPFNPGVSYRVFVGSTHVDVSLPAPKFIKATLTGVYPSATKLPENVFRFYIQFDQPMPRGDIYQYLAVEKADGSLVDQPFLQLDDELWNEAQTRVTVFIDPGRIKREVKPLLDLGPVFMVNKDYTLVVRGKWPTLAGTPLGKDFRRKLSITTRLDGELDTKKWTITPPTKIAPDVLLTFDRSMDYALLQHTLKVLDKNGNAIVGTAKLGVDERSWSFRPKPPLTPGVYRVQVQTILEDVCGNAIGRAFEVDITMLDKPQPKRPPTVELPFTVVKEE